MSGKRKRIPRPALPPPGLRPRVERDKVTRLSIAHWEAVDSISRGTGDINSAWHHVECCVTWGAAAATLSDQYNEIADARRTLEAGTVAAMDMIERHARTGRVAFTGPEYLMAKEACDAAELVASHVEMAAAVCAVEAGAKLVERMRDVFEQKQKVAV